MDRYVFSPSAFTKWIYDKKKKRKERNRRAEKKMFSFFNRNEVEKMLQSCQRNSFQRTDLPLSFKYRIRFYRFKCNRMKLRLTCNKCQNFDAKIRTHTLAFSGTHARSLIPNRHCCHITWAALICNQEVNAHKYEFHGISFVACECASVCRFNDIHQNDRFV